MCYVHIVKRPQKKNNMNDNLSFKQLRTQNLLVAKN